MLGMAAPTTSVLHRRVAERVERITPPADEAAAIGQAIQRLREANSISQEELAERLGVARQTISRYETGRTAVLRTDLQRQIASAIGVTIEALMTERDNVIRPDFPRRPGEAMPGMKTVVAVQAQPEIGEDGLVHYVEVPPVSSEDLGWLFGPNAGFVRLADGALPDGPFSARVAGFDRTAWPRRGQGCVIETRDGELLPRIYEGRTEGGVRVRGGDGIGEHAVPSNKVKGVYAIRYWGD
jgi:transcriptional regulator with XRE-family HTH domain